MTFKQTTLALGTLTVFRSAAQSPVLKSFRALCRALDQEQPEQAAEHYASVYSLLSEARSPGLGDYLLDLLRYNESDYAEALLKGLTGPETDAAARRDFSILSDVSALVCAEIKRELKSLSSGQFDVLIESLPEWKAGVDLRFDELKDFYRDNGCGALAKYRAFLWSGRHLTPIESPDTLNYERMVGYDWQRSAVLDNTKALLGGSAVNNMLLYGDSGTGKSATVKSMLGITGFEKLTLIEVSKQSLDELPKLIGELAWRPRKFILFIDDLSFETPDAGYSMLKVILEGGLVRRPANVMICATSNRRQLTRRHFSDQNDMNDTETVEEKTSLADRFGLRIPFFSLSRADYLDTAEALARQAGVASDRDELRKLAIQWEMSHGSRTPRTACQFAEHLAAGLLP